MVLDEVIQRCRPIMATGTMAIVDGLIYKMSAPYRCDFLSFSKVVPEFADFFNLNQNICCAMSLAANFFLLTSWSFLRLSLSSHLSFPVCIVNSVHLILTCQQTANFVSDSLEGIGVSPSC